MTGDGIAWNGGQALLLLPLPDAHYLATDSYDVQDRNDQEQEQTQGDGWEHGALVDIREEGFDEAHVVIAKEEEDDPRDNEYHDIQRDGEHLIWFCYIVRTVTYQKKIL